jgi:hypothetical protein
MIAHSPAEQCGEEAEAVGHGNFAVIPNRLAFAIPRFCYRLLRRFESAYNTLQKAEETRGLRFPLLQV